MRIRSVAARLKPAAAVLGACALLAGCDRPLGNAPVDIGVTSATRFAIDLTLDRPLSRAAAETASNYLLTLPGDTLAEVPHRATLVDTIMGRTVRLTFSLGVLPPPNSGVHIEWARKARREPSRACRFGIAPRGPRGARGVS